MIDYYLTLMPEEAALSEANLTFCSVEPSRTTGKRAIKAVSAAFVKKVKELGIRTTPLGRPPRRLQHNGSAFAAAFPTTAAPEHMDSSDSE